MQTERDVNTLCPDKYQTLQQKCIAVVLLDSIEAM